MNKKIALVEFPKSSFGQKYSYLTEIKDLNENDLLLVQTRTGYSLAYFKGYTEEKSYVNVATSWVVKNLAADVGIFEEKLFLGGFD